MSGTDPDIEVLETEAPPPPVGDFIHNQVGEHLPPPHAVGPGVLPPRDAAPASP